MTTTFSTSRRKALKLGLAATLAAPAVARAQQGWPSGPITWVNPFPAGPTCSPVRWPPRSASSWASRS